MSVCVCGCVFVCGCLCLGVWLCVCVFVCLWLCVCVCEVMYVYMSVAVCVCGCIGKILDVGRKSHGGIGVFSFQLKDNLVFSLDLLGVEEICRMQKE